jgi:sarcosine oxidase
LRRRPSAERHTCIVVGAGVVGLAAARAIALRDVDVLLLEAATSGHELAGSKGNARIFRLGYPDPLYVDMAVGALAHWRLLENESGLDLLAANGQVSFGPAVGEVADALTQTGMDFERLSSAEVARRFPALRCTGPALYEPESGVLAADACLAALRRSGSFMVRDHARVVALEDVGTEVVVTLADRSCLTAQVVVNCAGHDAVGLLAGVSCPVARPATVQQVLYLATPTDDDTTPPPVFIEWGPDMIYGLPVTGQPLYKVAQHVPGTPLPQDGDVTNDDPVLLSTLVGAVHRLLPALDPSPVATERCIYDNTADGDFIIDRVGRVVVGCGTSGHGFKFAPLLGELLADLTLGLTPPIDLSRFSLSRSFLHVVPAS